MPEKLSIKSCLRKSVKILKWKVEPGMIVYDGRVLLLYEDEDGKCSKLKSKNVGNVVKLLVSEGDQVNPGDSLLEIDEGCKHHTVINDLCAECGADLQNEDVPDKEATIPMVHSIPQLKVSQEQAEKIGRADVDRLLRDRKLVLLVDLDQTLIHTTHDNIPNNLRDVYHFQLLGPHSSWYHTRLRPGTMKFLKSLSKYYELHICTFGVRPYAHMIAKILDPDGSLFGGRILSRDECFSSDSKFANLQALFPCGDELVCIIDDRDDVWNYSPNLIQVKPYLFFRNTGDIHEPGVTPSSRASTYLAPGVRIKENTSSQVPLVPKSEELKNIDVDDDEDAVDDDMNEEMPNLDEQEKTEKPSGGEQIDEDPDQSSAKDSSSKDSKDLQLSGDKIVKDVNMDCTDKSVNSPQTEPEDLSCDKKVAEVPSDKDQCAVKTEDAATSDRTDIISTDKESSVEVDGPVKPAVEPMEEGANEEEDEDVEEMCKKMDEEGDSLYSEGKGKENEKTDKESRGDKAANDGMIDIDDEDDYLLYLEPILERVHRRFYRIIDKEEEGEQNMRYVIARERKSVLEGCIIVFSGLIPLKASLSESGTVLLATKLGAVVEEELSERTTHLVAAGRGTSKVHAASKMPHVKCVSPHWLITAAHRWEKVEEKLFPIGSGGPLPPSKPLPQANKDVPQFLTLSQEEMDAMSLEVDSLEDSENEDDQVSDAENDGDVEPSNADDYDEENPPDVGRTPADSSDSDDAAATGTQDPEEEWSQLGAEIEKGLTDFM